MADRWIIPIKVDLLKGENLKPCYQQGIMLPGDDQGHIIEVTIMSGGAPAEVAGNVRGYFIRQGGDWSTVVCNGSLSGNVASVTMSPQCYAYTGKLRCVVRIENTNGPDFTLIDTIFYVHEGVGDNIVDPGSPIQDVTELLEYLDEMQEATENAQAATSYIAYEYSMLRPAITPYAVGDYVIHDGGLYRCTTPITSAETWTAEHWTQVVFGAEVADLKSALNDIENDIRDTSSGDIPVTLDVQTDGYYANNGVFNGNDTARAYAIVTPVTPGDVYILSTFLRPNSISAIVYFNGTSFVSVEKTGSGSDETVTDYQFTIPSGVDKLIVQSANKNLPPELTLHSGAYTLKFYEKSETYAKSEVYNKTESDERYAKPSDISGVIDDNAGDGDTDKTWSADKLNEYSDILLTDNATEQTVSLTISTTGYYQNNGVYTSNDTARAHATVENVSPGESFLLTSFIRPTSISAILYYNGTTFISYEKKGSGSDETLTDYQFTIPSGANKVIVQSADKNKTLALKKIVYVKVSKSFTKAESDLRYGASKYGVRWSVSDSSDEGERCFGAVGLSATIGIGSTNGSSDFDSIYPWREIKRCNIKKNANGADVVTYEGETGFALDGTNGDVFVRIPKFYVERYISNGYEYRVITDQGVHPHEAFIENGAELDEIFISAFEGYIDGNSKMRSQGGVIPSNNEYESAYLNAAIANGDNYSLYDMRCVDAVWTLMAVEFGKRNSNKIIGWGLADFMLPLKDSTCSIIESGTNVNSVKVATMGSEYKALMPVGSTIQICSNNQQTILTQAKLTGVSDSGGGTVFAFDGDPITVDTDCFIGSAPMPTNSCESVSSGALSWHTGRANFVANSETRNPIRYRWIENPVGNVWHCLPDITFVNGQMFVCKNMTDYEFLKHDGTKYTPIGKVFEANTDNGNKGDVTGYNYWITSLADETFAKFALIGRSYDKSLLCGAAFGGYYYMYADRTVYIVNGGGFDHKWRCNMLTNRAWITANTKWFLYGARMMYKHIA